MNTFSFQERLAFSHGFAATRDMGEILIKEIPGAVSIEKSTLVQDKNGIDYFVNLSCGKRVSVDVKVREKDFGKDDLALENWSVVRIKRGWTLEMEKSSDYILWYWKDTKRWVLVPFLLLRKAFIQHGPCWWVKYPKRTQKSRNGIRYWESSCVFVPRKVVWDAMYEVSHG
jgi:hypothetical protein